MASPPSRSGLRVEWLWNNNSNPWSSGTNDEWRSYSDVETAIIEEAFQNKQSEAFLDDYHINFKNSVQISNTDPNKQRPVKRIAQNRSSTETRLREARFLPNPINPSTPFAGSNDLLGFVTKVLEHFDLLEDSSMQQPANRRKMIEKAAEGILVEGKLVGKQKEAEWIAQQLLNVREGTDAEVWQCCAHLYTMESFLYKKMNEYMRLEGDKQHEQVWKSKVATFGPFAHLLATLTFDPNYRKMTVYRGANLSDDQIDKYRQNIGQYVNFPAFTSTSRNRKKAEQFGNVLFIMNISSLDAFDVSLYSDYPDEEETLVRFDFAFYIKSCARDTNTQKWIIHLSSQKDG